MPIFSHQGISFNYIDLEEGIPFIFQHGLGGSVEQPLGIFTPPVGIRFLSLDFRGHGETPLGPEAKLNFNTFADDLIALMDHLHIEKAVTGGISMGAAVALNFVLRYPERTLGSVFSRPAWLDQAMDQDIRDLFAEIVELLLVDGVEVGRENLKFSARYKEMEQESPAVAQSFLGYFDYKFAVKTAKKYLAMPADSPCKNRQEWKLIETPVLIMANGADPIHKLEYGKVMSNIIPGAVFHEITAKSIDSKVHMLDVQKYLEEFLKKNFLNA